MSEERSQEELGQLVEAQASGEDVPEAEAPGDEQEPQERRLDRRKSKTLLRAVTVGFTQ